MTVYVIIQSGLFNDQMKIHSMYEEFQDANKKYLELMKNKKENVEFKIEKHFVNLFE